MGDRPKTLRKKNYKGALRIHPARGGRGGGKQPQGNPIGKDRFSIKTVKKKQLPVKRGEGLKSSLGRYIKFSKPLGRGDRANNELENGKTALNVSLRRVAHSKWKGGVKNGGGKKKHSVCHSKRFAGFVNRNRLGGRQDTRVFEKGKIHAASLTP